MCSLARGGGMGRRGVAARDRRASTCKTAVHICYGYGIKANTDWKDTPRRRMAAIRGDLPRASRKAKSIRSRSNAAIRKCRCELLALLKGKDVLVGVIDVASDDGRDAGAISSRPSKRRCNIRAEGQDPRLHQLRHGADASRYRGGEAQCARRRRGAGTEETGLA